MRIDMCRASGTPRRESSLLDPAQQQFRHVSSLAMPSAMPIQSRYRTTHGVDGAIGVDGVADGLIASSVHRVHRRHMVQPAPERGICSIHVRGHDAACSKFAHRRQRIFSAVRQHVQQYVRRHICARRGGYRVWAQRHVLGTYRGTGIRPQGQGHRDKARRGRRTRGVGVGLPQDEVTRTHLPDSLLSSDGSWDGEGRLAWARATKSAAVLRRASSAEALLVVLADSSCTD